MSADRSTSNTIIRREIRFSGHVQGVGFRYTTQDIARQYDVRGYVRNLPDGNVELIVEGDEREIDRLVNSIENRMGSFIRDVKSANMPATGEFNDFSIRH